MGRDRGNFIKRSLKLKRKFTEDEDQLILSMYVQQGIHDWKKIAKKLYKRTARQCRERYNHYLANEPKQDEWTSEEDSILLNQYNIYGPKWTLISKELPGRTSINAKNRYALLMRHKKKQDNQNEMIVIKSQEPAITCPDDILFGTFNDDPFRIDITSF